MTATTAGGLFRQRRKQLIWNQGQLARAAGVGVSTVVRLEKNRKVRDGLKKAVEEALDKEERKRAGGPGLSTPSDTTGAVKEGADAQRLAVAVADLRSFEQILDALLTNVRRTIAEVTQGTTESHRKSS